MIKLARNTLIKVLKQQTNELISLLEFLIAMKLYFVNKKNTLKTKKKTKSYE